MTHPEKRRKISPRDAETQRAERPLRVTSQEVCHAVSISPFLISAPQRLWARHFLLFTSSTGNQGKTNFCSSSRSASTSAPSATTGNRCPLCHS